MPSSKNYKRDYKEEYKVSQASPREKKSCAMRNAARRQLMKEGKVKKHDGKDVDHKTPIAKGGGNSRSNLRATSKSANRSFKRTKSARMA
jgi:5-methylcytosine-specific restriction endonuclease McrA